MKHFYYYPTVEYGNETLVNIMLRGKIRDAILENVVLYYQYQITDGTRPDVLAEKYYGNPRNTWAIFYANNMFHPIYDWPMDNRTFSKYLEEKYGVSYPRGALAMNHHYELYNTNTKQRLNIDRETYLKYGSPTKTAAPLGLSGNYGVMDSKTSEYYEISGEVYTTTFSDPSIIARSISIYDHEVEKNEARRNIYILDKKYLTQITNELITLFK